MSYLDALFTAIRGAGRQVEAVQRWLASAEGAELPGWRLQALAAAQAAHIEASACLDAAGAHLRAISSEDGLPAPLDQLPARLDALRATLLAAEERLIRVASAAADGPLGDA